MPLCAAICDQAKGFRLSFGDAGKANKGFAPVSEWDRLCEQKFTECLQNNDGREPEDGRRWWNMPECLRKLYGMFAVSARFPAVSARDLIATLFVRNFSRTPRLP
jgi:hypothetical protein